MTSSDCDLSRDPFDSILAEFNRRSGGHIGHASLEKFRKEEGKVPGSSPAAQVRYLVLAW